jgi:hypothetical protein
MDVPWGSLKKVPEKIFDFWIFSIFRGRKS